jgi:hypothetical protein
VNHDTRWRQAGGDPATSVDARAIVMSKKGPAPKPAGFHQEAVLSEATATNAPPIPSARAPTASTIWAPAGTALATAQKHSDRLTSINGRNLMGYNFDRSKSGTEAEA